MKTEFDHEENLSDIQSNNLSYLKGDDSTSANNKLFVTIGNRVLIMDTSMVKYILASDHYVEIYTADNKKYVTRDSLKNLDTILNPNIFHRIHRSTIINIDHALELVQSEFGETDIRMKDQKTLRISKSFKGGFLKKIGVK